MFFHYLDASSVGGIETHVETLALSQNAAGQPAAIVLHRDHAGSRVRKRYEDKGIAVHVAGSAFGLMKLLMQCRPSILHTHGYKAGILGRPLARLARVPVISTFHAGERGQGRVALYQFIDEWTSFAGGRLAVSRQIASSIPFEAQVMRNFVPLAPEARPVPNENRFIFAGRLSHEKGPDIFCELARASQASGSFDIHGDGPMRSELERQHGEFVTFHGFTDNIRHALGGASALVMTSRNEGLPMIALEAMALGVPVIAPAIGGLPDLISHGRNGFLFEAKDIAGLKSALQEFCALSHSEAAAMGEAARRTIGDNHSPRIVLPILMDAYERAGLKSSRSMSTKVQSSIG